MHRTQTPLLFGLLASTALAGPFPTVAGELPTGGSVAHGAVTIASPRAGAMAITQSSPTAIVNWQGFSIGAGARVDIAQPSAAAALLNRVTGSAPSTIAGQLNANGQVFLVNPNGIAITRTGTVRAGGFVGSSLAIADEDFKAGRLQFRGGGSSAAVSNAGRIEIGRGGFAALLGGEVDNAGLISVPMGRVGLGAGERATLDLSGDGFLQVSVPSGSSGERALVQQGGRIRAPGGRVEMRAATARDAARQVINVSGIVEARSVGGRNGAIVLGGGEGGRVTVSGRLDARGGAGRRAARAAPAQLARGGAITITGHDIRLAGARLDASGTGGGGQIRIGGDYQGGPALQRAARTSVDAGTTIRADALGSGDGGRVIVWSDLRTTFAGQITARGGESGGDGGFAEVSGKGLLAYSGFADLKAPKGLWGTLLLDPYNITISAGPTVDGTLGGGTFTPSGDPTLANSNLNNGELQTALGAANVVVSTGVGPGSPGAQAGNITVAAPVTWAAPTVLTLIANNAIAINAAITAPAGGLTLSAGNPAATPAPTVGAITASGAVGVRTFDLVRGNWVQNAAALPSFAATDFRIAAAPNASFLRAAGGTGSFGPPPSVPANPYIIVDAYGLQGIGSSPTLLASNYVLGGPIDGGVTAGWNGGLGFRPIGTAATPFTGALNGATNTISGLTIARPTEANVGLFGALRGSVVRDLGLVGASITGGPGTGAVVGTATGTVSNVTVAGRVTGTDNVGGLVGIAASASISGSSTNAQVTGANTVGGLVGFSSASSIVTSAAGGPVSGTDNVGGLVGAASFGSISNSTATGPVTGGSQVGGLVGIATGVQIFQSYATGAVTGTDLVGGLVGAIGNDGSTPASVSQSYANGAVTSQGRAGGLVGLASNGSNITDSYATGRVTGAGPAGGLIGEINSVPSGQGPTLPVNIANTYATGLVSGAGPQGGSIGNIFGALQTVATSYWDTQTTGQATSAGGPGAVGQTTAQLQGALPAGFTTPPWSRLAANTYPFLTWRFPAGPLAVSGIVRAAAGPDPGAPLPGEPTTLAAGGVLRYRTDAGANGYYYFSTDPLTGPAPQGATAFLDGANRGSSTADAPIGAGALAGLDVRVGRALVRTGQPTSSGLATLLSTAGGSALSPNIPYTVPPAGAVAFGPGVSLAVEATNPGGFTLDRSIVANGSALLTGGPGVSAGPLTIAAGQTLQSLTGDIVVATSRFTNAAGPTGLQAAGRFLVYSADYDADVRGGLVGGNLYNRTFTANPPATISQAGSRFIFSRQPTVTLGASGTREYANLPSFTFTPTVTGLVNGDTAAQAFTGAPAATDTSAVTTPVGIFPGAVQVAPGSVAATDIGYAIAFANGPLTVTPAPLTVRANDRSKLYGDTLSFAGTEFTATGLRNADQVASTTLASPGAPATAPVAGSPYPITASNAVGSGLSNYTITYAPGALTVNPAPLTVRANDRSKLYGDTLSFTGTEFTAAGLRNADQVASTTLASPGVPATAPVAGSPYPITASNAVGSGLSNYTITYAPGALTVSPAPLTVRANDRSKLYGDTLSFGGTEFTATGLRNADQVATATLTSPGAPPTAPVAGSPYPITASSPTGTGLANYAITFEPGSLAVAPAPLAIRANDATKPFGRDLAFTGTEITATGLRNADAVSAVTLTSPGAPAAAAAEGSPYPILASDPQGVGLTSGGVSNYAIAFTPGALTVTAPERPPIIRPTALEEALSRPTLSRQLPDVFAPVSTFPDAIDLSGGGVGGGGPTLGTGPGPRVTAGIAADTLGFVQRSSNSLERRVDACERRGAQLTEYTACVSEALEQYANDLDTRILQLPPPLRAVTALIRQAARRVATAPTIEAARIIVRTAVAEVRKAIALIRADEPAVSRLQVRQGNVIASALQAVDTKLARAVGL